MYFEHFGLARPPFEDTTNPSFFYAAAAQRAILEELTSALNSERSMILVMGPDGAGKSLMGQVLTRQIGESARVVNLAVPPVSPDGISRLAGGFGSEMAVSDSMERKIAQLVEVIHEQNGPHTVVIVDRAENLAPEDLQALHRLGRAAANESLRVHVVLFASPRIEATLRMPQAKRVAKRLRRVRPFEQIAPREIKDYLAVRLEAAGGQREDIFERDAIERMVVIATRWPRQINALAKRAMTRAAARQARSIGSEDIDAAIVEIQEMPVASTVPAAPIVEDDSRSPIAARVEQALATGPQQLRALEIGLGRIREEANRLITEAQGRLERAAGVKAEISTDLGMLTTQRTKLDSTMDRAEELHQKLAEFTKSLGQVEESSQDRLGLLMTSLDAAQGIHDKLQRVGDDVVGLAEEAQQAAAAERERLEAMVEELHRGRTELTSILEDARARQDEAGELQRKMIAKQLEELRSVGTEFTAQAQAMRDQVQQEIAKARSTQAQQLEDARRKQEDAFAAQRQAISKQLEELRVGGAESVAQAHAIREQVQHEIAEARAAQGKQAVADRTELQAGAASALEEIRRMVATASREAADERNLRMKEWERDKAQLASQLKEVHSTAVDVRHTAEQAVQQCREMLGNQRRETAVECAALQSAATDIQTGYKHALAEAQRAVATIQADLECIRGSARDHAAQLTAITDAQNRTRELVDSAKEAQAAVTEQIVAAGKLGVTLHRETEQVVRTRETAMAAIENAAKQGEQRIQDSLKQFEIIAQTEMNSREAARDALVAARTALAQVNDAQDRLAQAQQAAIDVEAAAASTRASVQTEIKRAEEAIRTVTSAHVDKAQAVINSMVDDAARTARQTLTAVESAAVNAAKRIRQDITTAGEEASLEHEAARIRSMEAASELALATTATCDRLSAVRQTALDAADEALHKTEEARARIAQTMSAIQEAGESAMQSLRSVAVEASGDVARAASDASATAQVSADALAQTINRAKAAADEIAQDVKQIATRVAEKASAAIDSAGERAHAGIGQAAASALSRASAELEEMIGAVQAQFGKRLDETVRDEIDRIGAHSNERISAAEAALSGIAAGRLLEIEQAGTSITEQSTKKIGSVAQSAAQTIQEQLAAAGEAARNLQKGIRAAKETIQEASTCREQVDHSIRDVWSLTTTTDQRARSLAALSETAEQHESTLADLLKRIEECSNSLSKQTAGAEAQASALVAQNKDMMTKADELAKRMLEAGEMDARLDTARNDARLLTEAAGVEAERLTEGLGTARQALGAIIAADAKTRATAANLADLANATTMLDGRVTEIQQSIAQPLAIIQNARSQAEELNEICLGVKRVFRGVSQASVEAGERLNLLKQLLGATERAAHTMKQWVEEANRARDRLATTLSHVPTIQQTHPALAVPELASGQANGGRAMAKMSGDSINSALIQELLGKKAEARAVANASAHAGARQAALSAVTAAANRAESSRPAAKQVEPLMDVLKAKAKADSDAAIAQAANGEGAKNGDEGALVGDAVGAQDSSAGRVIKSDGPRTNGSRLRPEDVRAMIEEARKRTTPAS